jgi:hypothetical protein
MKSYAVMAAELLLFAALPVLAIPIGFPECPAVGNDTSGCELLITVTAASNGVATAFTVTTSSPDLGSYNGGDGTLIGILNSPSDTGGVFHIDFEVAGSTFLSNFDKHGACLGTGSPLVSAYSPGPTAAQCLQGHYQTADAFDYATSTVTFPNLPTASLNVSSPLGPGQSAWFSLPDNITASQITIATPEPASLLLVGIVLSSLYFMRRRKASDEQG